MLTTIADLNKGQEALDPFLHLAASLSDRYFEHLESAEGAEDTRRPGIHASELGCKRKVFYTLTSAPKMRSIPKVWRQRFAVGHALHKMVQDQFEAMAEQTKGILTFEAEIPITASKQEIASRLHLESRCDGVFSFYRASYRQDLLLRVGLEIKTEAPDAFESLKGPRHDHIRQAHLYMKALDLPLLWFYYFNKGNQNHTLSYKPWLIAFDEAVWQKLEEECVELLDRAEVGQPPEKSEGVWCEFCPYRGRQGCNPAYLSRRAARTFDPQAVR